MSTDMTPEVRTTPRAEHVGSLLRPRRLLDALQETSTFSTDHARPTNASLEFAEADEEALREVEDACIREAVARQEAAGVDVVTDGEFRRVFFMGSFDRAVRGFAPNSDDTIAFRDDKGKALRSRAGRLWPAACRRLPVPAPTRPAFWPP